MKKTIHFLQISICFIFLLSFLDVQAQSNASVFVNARAQTDKILIRWAVDAPFEWQQANDKGFILSRMLIKKNGQLLESPEKVQIAILKAEPLDEWISFIQKDNYAAIVAQALFGESFDVEQNNDGGLAGIVNIADELNQRYTFSLYAADMSFTAAKKAGWGFVDTDVKADEVYIYQVSVVDSPQINPGAYMVGLEDYEVLPNVTDFLAIPYDRQVLLSWGIDRLKNTYTSYMIENSVDGKKFQDISSTPIVDINSNSEKNSKQMFFGSKLGDNETDYYFRIYGISAFGEKGPVSKVVKVKGIPSTLVAPHISNYTIPNADEVELEWEFPKEEEGNIKNFVIQHTEKENTTYKTVVKDIDKHKRKFVYKELRPSNYFKVVAIDKQDKHLSSQSVLVQPIDSIPPLKPTGLKGEIDSLGNVVLRWDPNKEKDLAGYRLLRANTENEEFVDVFNKTVIDNTALDIVSFSVSNKKVFYSLLAEDFRYNRSEFSDILIIEKPDKNPPTAPIFKDYETFDGKIALNWANSSSDDVEKHLLKRRKKGETEWVELASFSKEETNFTDEKVEADQTYEYLIQAKDKSGLWSSAEMSVITITAIDMRPLKVLKNIEAVPDRAAKTLTLYWSYNSKSEVTEVQIYKNIKGQKPSLWKVLDAKFQSITDKNLNMNTEYEYYFVPSISANNPAKGEKIDVVF